MSTDLANRITPRGQLAARSPEILLVGFSPEDEESIRRLVGHGVTLLPAADEEEAFGQLAGREIALLCLGAGMRQERARAFLETHAERDPAASTINLVLAGGPDLSLFVDLVSQDRIYYLTQEPVLDADFAAIVRSALERWRSRRLSEPGEETGEQGARRLQEIVEVARRVALQRSLASAGELTEQAIASLLAADRAYYLIYEAEREVLWAGEAASRGYREESAAVGLVSFVARTGRAVLLDRLGRDPRYEREADDPEGDGAERFLAVPVRGSSHSVLAVLVAVRSADRPAFVDGDLVSLELLADQVASSFNQLALQSRLDTLEWRRGRALNEGTQDLFREEAVSYHASGPGDHGDVLRLTPGWTRWTYRLLLVLLAAGLIFTLVGTLKEWASGPAVVRIGGTRELTATAAATVTVVEVEPGQRVEEGQLLVRFYGAQELAELQRIEAELELQLINRLRNPSDRGAEAALIALRAQRQLAEARLSERALRAPLAGEVGNIRVRPGQHVAPGEVVLSLASGGIQPSIVALLPGHYRPLVTPGMPIRFEVQGYEYAYLDLVIAAVSDEVIGPAEALRALGPGAADLVAVASPVVLVEARLPARTFQAAGVSYVFHDGMVGTAEVPVRSNRILVALFPQLKLLFERGGPGAPEGSGG